MDQFAGVEEERQQAVSLEFYSPLTRNAIPAGTWNASLTYDASKRRAC